MKKNLIILLVGIVLGSGSYWSFRDGPLASKVRESKLVQHVSDTVEERATNKLKEEMDKQGKITMSKPANMTTAIIDDGKLSDLVKAKIAAEPMLSGTDIRQDVKDGEVTLRGTATSYDQVGRAMRLALECGATRTVVSTIEVKAK